MSLQEFPVSSTLAALREITRELREILLALQVQNPPVGAPSSSSSVTTTAPSVPSLEDYITNPAWQWQTIIKENQLIGAGSITSPTSQELYSNTNLAGYVYYIRAASTSPFLVFTFNFAVQGGTFQIPLDFSLLQQEGFNKGLTTRLLQYDTTNGNYASETFGGFPGLPINGAVSITADNYDSVAVTYSLETIIYQLTG